MGSMSDKLGDPIMRTLLSELERSLGPALKELWLYGSRARGDAEEGSDYDVLVVAEGDLAALREFVREAEWRCMEAHNALVSCLVYTPEAWELRKETPLGWNILREGRRAA